MGIRLLTCLLSLVRTTGENDTCLEDRETLPHLQSRFISDLKIISGALLPENDRINLLLENLNITRCEKIRRISSEGIVERLAELCTSLDLSHSMLSRLPMSAMALMPNLRELDVSGNPDLMIVPKDIELLERYVEKLIIRDSNVSRETLELIMEMPKLTSLDISHNDLSDSLMKDGFEFTENMRNNLTELKVSKCKLGSEALSKISALGKLTTLDISRNRLVYPGDVSLRNGLLGLKGILTDLNISHCKLHSEWLTEVTGFRMLKRLNISHNLRLGESIPAEFSIGRLGHSIVELNLAETNIPPHVLVEVCKSWQLKRLNVSSNPEAFAKITANGFKGICDTLEWLEAVDTNLGSVDFDAISYCTRLRFLNVSGNPNVMDRSSCKSLVRLRKTLVELRVSGTSLSPESFKTICNSLKHVERLDISRNPGVWEKVTATDFRAFGSRLVELIANLTAMQPCHMKMLNYCNHLKVLDISYNDQVLREINGAVLAGSRRSLTELRVSGVRLNSRELEVLLKGLHSLKKLDISSNAGAMNELPFRHFEVLSEVLTELNASDMQLNPLTMMVISQCRRLKRLDISDNDDVLKLITHRCFASLKRSLVSLDISRCGVLPYEFDVIRGCRNLKRLIADGNRRMIERGRGLGLQGLKETVEELSLSNVGLKPRDFREICGFVKLERLNVSRNEGAIDLVTNEELSGLEGTLVELNLKRCTRHFTVLRRISKVLPKVRIIY